MPGIGQGLRSEVMKGGGGGGGGIVSTESETASTEDTISALLEVLVDPVLPLASSLERNKAISSAQEESVAKQVQAVMLLYDCYHRKCNSELEFLDHVSFCKLAVVLKPNLVPFMKVIEKDDEAGVDDPDKQLSLTVKMIIEACDISKSVKTSKAGIEGWPIAKVAVFLVDSSKECCFLLQSSNTQGVWSVIEKEHSLNLCSEGAVVEEKVGSKKKRITKKPLKENQSVDEIGLRLLAFAAVKETCGYNQKDLVILEGHTAYSLSKANTAVRFYIMQWKQTKEEDRYVPIRDVLDSLQGPLVMKESRGWLATSLVEYFPLLPYAGILSDWFSGKPTLETLHEAASEQVNGEQPSSNSKGEDDIERDQSHTVASISNEVSPPSEVSPEKDLEAGDTKTATKANFISNEVSAPCEVLPKKDIEAGNHTTATKENSILNGVSAPCKVLPKKDLEAGNSNNATKTYTSQKFGTGREAHIVNSVTTSKESPKRDVESGNCNTAIKENSIPSEVSAPCKMSRKKDLEAGNSNTATKTYTSQKFSTGREVHIVNSVTLHKESPKKDLEAGNCISAIKASFIPDEVIAPCKVSPKKDLEVGNTTQNIGTGREVHIVNSVTRGNTLVHIVQGLKKSDRAEEPVETVVYTKRRKNVKKDKVDENSGWKLSKASAECSMQKYNVISVPSLSNNMEIDEPVVSSVDCSMDGKNRSCGDDHVANRTKAVVALHNNQPSLPTDVVTKEEIVSTLHSNHEQNGKNSNAQVTAISSCEDGVRVNTMIPFQSKPRELDKMQKVISMRENLISQAALKVLYRKRDMLSYQLRSIEDESALCNRNIEALLNGSEDDLGVKLDSIIEGCLFENLSGGVSDHERTYQHLQEQNTRKYLKRKRLCEANLSVSNPCQELDDICHENCWELPAYSVSTSDGGFEAGVSVKGVDFECSSIGGTYSSPREAREYAASSVLTKLRNMATGSS